MLQNARFRAYTVSNLLRENQQGVGIISSLPPRLGLRTLGQHLGTAATSITKIDITTNGICIRY